MTNHRPPNRHYNRAKDRAITRAPQQFTNDALTAFLDGEAKDGAAAAIDDAGMPFALCITRVDNADRDTPTKMSHDLAAAGWVQNALGYVLIGADNSTLAQDLRKGL